MEQDAISTTRGREEDEKEKGEEEEGKAVLQFALSVIRPVRQKERNNTGTRPIKPQPHAPCVINGRCA